jgi:hypothetical protein
VKRGVCSVTDKFRAFGSHLCPVLLILFKLANFFFNQLVVLFFKTHELSVAFGWNIYRIFCLLGSLVLMVLLDASRWLAKTNLVCVGGTRPSGACSRMKLRI